MLVSGIARETPYSAEYLSLLVRTNKIFGKKFGRNWFISKKALAGYLKIRGVAPAQQLPQQWRNFMPSHQGQTLMPRVVLADASAGSTSRMGEIMKREEEKGNKKEETIAAETKKHLDELENIYKNNETQNSQFETPIPEKQKNNISSFTIPDTSYKLQNSNWARPKFPEILERVKWEPRDKGVVGSKSRWAEILVVSIVTLVLILGGFNLKFANALYGAAKEFFGDATTLQGHAPGTHASEILLLDKEGKISIYGHIETQGQFRSFVQQGIAPIVVDSSTTVANLSAEFLDGLSARDFTLQVVTKNGNITFDNVKLEGGAEIGSLLKVKGAANFLDYISIAKNLSVGGDLVVNGRSTLSGGADIFGRLAVKGDIDVTNFIAAQRAQIKEGGLIVSGHTQLNTLGISGGLSVADLGVSGNFSVAGKDISIGDSWGDKLNVNASSTFSGPFLVSSNEAKFGRGLTVLANGASITGASSIIGATGITGALTVTGDTTITGNLALGGSTSGGTGLGIGTSSPGAALGVKGAGIFDGFLSANYFTSTSSLTSWIMGQMGIGTTTPGAQMGVRGSGLFDGFVSADYFTSTSSNTSWLMGSLGIGTTTPGTQLAINGSTLSEGFVSADYFTSTSTNTSWLMGTMGLGTTTPGSRLSVNGAGIFNGFVSANYFTSTSSLTSWLMGQVGIGTTTPGSQLSIKGSTLSEGFVSADYFTSTSSNTSWLMGQMGIGSTTPGAQMAVNGAILSEGFVSADYYTSTSTNTNWFNGAFGLGTTTPGARLSVKGSTLLEGDLTVSFLKSTSTVASSFGGSLGIATTSPWGLLSIEHTTAQDFRTPSFVISDAGTSTPSIYVDGGYGRVGFGTSSPYAQLSIEITGEPSNNFNEGLPAFVVSSRGTSTPAFYIASSNGNVGFSTSSPGANFSIGSGATALFSSTATTTFSGGLNVKDTGGLSSATGLTITGGDIISSGKLTLTGASTSTIPQLNVSTILTTPILDISTIIKNSGTATSSFAGGLSLGTGGLNITSGGLYVDVGDVTFDQKLVVNGNVGIGTTSPASLASIGGDLFVGASTAGGTRGVLGIGIKPVGWGTGFSVLDFPTASIFDDNGTTLVLNSNLSHNGTNNIYKITGAAGQLQVNANQLLFYNAASGSGGAAATLTERMRIDTNGNVGIGTTGPIRKLDVVGGIGLTADNYIFFNGASSGSEFLMRYNSSNSQTEFVGSNDATASRGWLFKSSVNPIMFISQNGNVGIGTTNPYSTRTQITAASGDVNPLRVTTNDFVGGTTGSSLALAFGAASGNTYGAIQALSAGASVWNNLVLQSGGGNVGIGTTSPTALLAIGAAGALGNYITGSNISIGDNAPISGIELNLKDTSIRVLFDEAGAGVDDRRWDFLIDGEQFLGRAINDSETLVGSWLTVDRTDQVIDTVGLWLDDEVSNVGLCYSGAELSADALRNLGDCIGTGADYAESFPTASGITYGDIVMTSDEIILQTDGGKVPRLVKAVSDARHQIIGVVSDNYHDFTSAGKEIIDPQYNPLPVALNGRVPVKVNLEGGDIAVGDRIGLSSVAGVGRKANTAGYVVGTALEPFTVASTGNTVMVFVGNEKYTPESQLTVDSTGNIGLGTTTPSYKLHVLGDIAATSFVNISTASSKKDIDYLDTNEEKNILEKIKDTNVATYHYNIESSSNPMRLGLIAENAPSEVLSVDGKGVDIYKLSSFILAGVKAQQMAIEDLKTRVVNLESQVGITPSSPSSPAPSSSLSSTLLSPLKVILTISKSALASLTNSLYTLANSVLAETTKLSVVSEDSENINYQTNGVTSSRDEIIASGSATLVTASDANGQFAGVKIKFDESFIAATSETEPIKVILTPTTRLNGALYVAQKSRFGFEAREINAQDEGGMFDWLVIARKKGAEENGGNGIQGGEMAPSAQEPIPAPSEPIVPIVPIEPVTPPVDSETSPPPAEEVVTPPPAEETITP